MRVTIFCFLILTLLNSGAISWNDETTKNWNPKNGDPLVWVACNAKDNDGTLNATAHIEVDIDYVLEPRISGVQYRANARAFGTADPDAEGSWNCYAYVPNDSDPKSDSWWANVNKGAEADWKDYFFIWDAGDVDPVPKLWNCTASAGVDGTQSGVEYEAIADAWNFF